MMERELRASDSARGRGKALAGGGRAWGSELVIERFVQNRDASLCLVTNVRTRSMRVVDFRAGASLAKRNLVLELARAAGVERVHTLVERDEVASWKRMGFVREATILGYYKRSDAHVLGCLVAHAAADFSIASSIDDDDDDSGESAQAPSGSGCDAIAIAERTIARARRLAREHGGARRARVKLVEVSRHAVAPHVARSLAGPALTAFEPFGRDVSTRYFSASGRGGCELVLKAESQGGFGAAFVELLTTTTAPGEQEVRVAAVDSLLERLSAAGHSSAFAIAPSDDERDAELFLRCGFRRSGLLRGYFRGGRTRRDGTVWVRKIAGHSDS